MGKWRGTIKKERLVDYKKRFKRFFWWGAEQIHEGYKMRRGSVRGMGVFKKKEEKLERKKEEKKKKKLEGREN